VFSQRILEIPVAEIEPIVEPDSVTDDIGRESVTFVRIHSPILAISARLLVSTDFTAQIKKVTTAALSWESHSAVPIWRS
jgi:hypothetical protein